MISIITAYYNRKALFVETLKSISRSKYKDIELIAVDDCSDKEHNIEDLIGDFPFLNVVCLYKKNKWYTNPCIPFNIGIRQAKGDIILLQNPECLHVNDVLSFMVENVTDKNYITTSTYGLNAEYTTMLPFRAEQSNFLEWFKDLPQDKFRGWDINDGNGWYNHPVYSPTYYHFCSVMTKRNMDKLQGFDERYATGIAYDDDDLVERITRLGLQKIITTDVIVIHQNHSRKYNHQRKNYSSLWEKNKILFNNVTKKETQISWIR